MERKIDRRNLLSQVKVLLLLVGLTGVVIAPMLERSYPINHSTQFNLSWAFQYYQQFSAGQFYPRWLEFSNFGFGNATFAFYPPLCMVATLPFRLVGLGLSASLIASMGLAIGLWGLGMYGYARCFYPRWIAAGVAGVGMVSPYFLVDLYQRGAIGEVWAIATLPWILWASRQVVVRPQRRSVLLLALAYGTLILSHLPTLLIFTTLWIFLPWVVGQPEQRWQSIKGCYGGFLLAIGWTAFFLLPAILDQSFVQVDLLNTISPDYVAQNRLMLTGLWRFHPQITQHWFDKELVKPWWGMVAIASLAAGLYYQQADWQSKAPDPGIISNYSRTVRYWLLISAIALLMMTDLLSWLYSSPLPFQRIQFSWRWMSITTVTMPLLLGYLLHRASMSRHQRRGALSLAGVVLALMALTTAQGMQAMEKAVYDPDLIARFASLAAAKQFPIEPQQRPGNPILDWHWVFPDGLALVDVPEYRAKAVTLAMPPDRVYPLLEWQDGRTDPLKIDRWQYGIREFSATNSAAVPAIARLRTFYYPAWRTQIDDKWVETEKNEVGQLQVAIPPGEHHISIRYLGTASDWLGRGVTLLTGIGMVGAGAIALRRAG